MDRTSFYKTITTDDTQEIDFLFHNLSNFKPKYKLSKYRVNEIDLMRPDLISYRAYGTVKYWWIVLSLNKIENPFVELEIGDIIELPNVLDIYDFYKRYASK